MRNRFFLAVAVILAALPVNLAWGQANLPNNPNAATVQGPDPTGMLGYPLATVPATGALAWPVTVGNFPAVQTIGASYTSQSFTLNNVGDTAQIDASAYASVKSTYIGTHGGVVSILFEESADGISWVPFSVATSQHNTTSPTTNQPASQYAFNGLDNWVWLGTVSSRKFVRVRLLGNTVAGAVVLTFELSSASGMVYVTGGTVTNAPVTAPQSPKILDNTTSVALPLSPVGSFVETPVIPYLWGGINNSVTIGQVAQRTPVKFLTVQASAAGNTALWVPSGANLKFRLMRWRYTATGSATTAGGADITLKLFDGAAGVTGQQDTVTVPAAATTLQGQLATSPWIDLGNGYLSIAANNTLNVNLSAALSAGTVTVEAVGTEE